MTSRTWFSCHCWHGSLFLARSSRYWATTSIRLIWPEWQNQPERPQSNGFVKTVRKTTVWVADVDGKAVGFLAYELNIKDKAAEVQLLAVHPDYQNLGIGTELNSFALEKMKESGIKMAVVETGGDPSHAPARRSYEKAGYTPLPIVRYFKDL